MQAKGIVKFFAIALLLVCIYQLSFTYKAYKIDNEAQSIAENVSCDGLSEADCSAARKQAKNDYYSSLVGQKVYNLGIKNFTYEEVRSNQLTLGLDLQGGMSVIMQVSIRDMLIEMAGPNRNDEVFQKAIKQADKEQLNSSADYIDLFLDAFEELYPDNDYALASVFANLRNEEIIQPDDDNDEIRKTLQTESADAIDRAFSILQNRIDKFGVSAASVNRLSEGDRILIELPGVDNPNKVRKLLQATANLEFWETYALQDMQDQLRNADEAYQAYLEEQSDEEIFGNDSSSAAINEGDSVTAVINGQPDSNGLIIPDEEIDTLNPGTGTEPLLNLLGLNNPASGVGASVIASVPPQDTAAVNKALAIPEVRESFNSDVKFLWSARPDKETGNWQLHAIKLDDPDDPTKAPIFGDVVTSARQEFDDQGKVKVTMSMNTEGANAWSNMTARNVDKFVAIVLDDRVESAPRVIDRISGGRTEITGNFSIDEGKALASVLESGKLPAPAYIVQETQVGPTLGKESIQAGILSMVSGLILVLLFMIFYYGSAGVVSDLALVLNIFFIFGALAALNATLTLPGMAGIVLTIGMAVDANVIIFERIREEILRGKGISLAIKDGFNASYSAIIDANLTTLITAAILYYFGVGPVKGFAIVLMIGIFSSMFTAVLVARLFFDWMENRKMKISFGNNMTLRAFSKVNFSFINKRKIAYVVSGALVLISLVSIFTKGFELGVDFKGGRAFTVVLDNPTSNNKIRDALVTEFGNPAPQIKKVSLSNSVQITTSYLVDSTGIGVDSMVQARLLNGLIKSGAINEDVDYKTFSETKVEQYNKVSSTIADDIRRTSETFTIIALICIGLYIFIRFQKWQYSVGAITALLHDSLIVLGIFSLFAGILPFSMEIDQAFIAALLTVIGYSINDTVVVFDRIRENLSDAKKGTFLNLIDRALNDTLSRTLITSGTTLVVVIVLLLFGGDVIRGFSFAIFIGIFIGTYSSIFVASPLMFDLTNLVNRKKAEKAVLNKKGR